MSLSFSSVKNKHEPIVMYIIDELKKSITVYNISSNIMKKKNFENLRRTRKNTNIVDILRQNGKRRAL